MTTEVFKTYEDAEAYIQKNGFTETHEIVHNPRRQQTPWTVFRHPQIGDPVSKYFNGDCYPEGEIVKISATGKKVTTSTGEVFWRKKGTAAWLANGLWSMVMGHREERNPHI